MKTIIMFFIVMMFITAAYGQDNSTGSKDIGIVINLEMIKRFNDVKTEGDIYSWSQLLNKENSTNVLEFVVAYRNCDLNEQTLKSIQTALNKKSGVDNSLQNESPDDYYAYLNRVKKEINQKLNSVNQVAMK